LAAKKSGGDDDTGGGKKGKDNASTKTKDGADGGDDEDEDDPHKKIHKFFKSLLKQWEDDLAHRPDSVKHTAAGRNETKTYKQCKDYIRPLFKMCKTRRLEPGIMAHILNIITYCEQGEFVKANDAYIDVAIGRAAWPIGVTMVGIHARSGREKIGSSNVAHVMNNELQRKYLTSVKRLMSYCQKKRADVDPSKKVVM
jgi:pre-mRNA-splicing factor 18